MTSYRREEPPRARMLPRLASVGFVAIASGVTLWSGMPPRALPADAPADQFSAARAMRHVEAIAREPHPLGSDTAEKVRAYLLAELKALGLEPEIQEPHDARRRGSGPGSASGSPGSRSDVRNIVARWRGSGAPSKKALFLSAHYDSVANGPGAGDDAAGVAAILESLRALKTGPNLPRDVIILINDGEEADLYGADVFAGEHPWAKDVGVVLNFDARGNSGPVYMFETSDEDGWLIEQLAYGLPHPLATSLTSSIYRLMPNNTDLTIYKLHGMSGLNFACVGGLSFYHSPQDTPANLDQGTLQHYGESLLAMARHLGRLDLDDVRRPDVVYFSVLSRFVVRYAMTWVIPLLECAGAAYVIVIALGMLRKRVLLGEVLAGFAVFALAALAAALAVGMIWLVLRDILANVLSVRFRFDVALLTVFSVVALVVAAAVFTAASRLWSWEGLGLGVMGWWLAAAAATSVWLPGASYAFVWPSLAILAGQAVAFAVRRGGTIALGSAWLCAVPLLVLHITILRGVFDALNLRMAALLMVPVVLAGGALVPLFSQALSTRQAH